MRQELLLAWAEELERSLAKDLIDLWFPRCVHPAGGFHQGYDRRWRPVGGEDRFLVFQSRVVWSAATLAEAWPNRSAELLGIVRHGMEMLVRMRSDRGGMFRTSTDPSGRALGEDAELQAAYPLAFALFALSAAARVDESGRALSLAKETYRWIETHLWDAERGGYFELALPDGTPVLEPRGRYRPRRTHNSAMHLFEAFLELARVWPDPAVVASARRVLDWMIQHLLVEPGTFLAWVDLDNRPLDGEIAYGHDVETAHLVLDAARFADGVVGREDAVRLARRLVDHALKAGWDESAGAFWGSGTLEDGARRSAKIWWVQAECLYGLVRMAEEADPCYLEPAGRLWDWIRTRQLDAQFGGWLEEAGDGGQPPDDALKGHRWKAMYHETRGLLYSARSLRRMTARA
ncbi:MAG: AGE family epimerase/isomerase [Fimbriimonadaceae bacterium]